MKESEGSGIEYEEGYSTNAGRGQIGKVQLSLFEPDSRFRLYSKARFKRLERQTQENAKKSH